MSCWFVKEDVILHYNLRVRNASNLPLPCGAADVLLYPVERNTVLKQQLDLCSRIRLKHT